MNFSRRRDKTLKFLAIDSTGHFSSVGFFEESNNKLLINAYRNNFLGEQKNTAINILISDIMKKVCFNNLEFIAVSIGPGSFTKIRSSLSFAKGLSFGLNVPLIGINGFDKLYDVSKSYKQDNTGLLMISDTFRKTSFVSLQIIDNKKTFNSKINIIKMNDIRKIEKIRSFEKIAVLGDLSNETYKELMNNKFNLCKMYPSHYAYGEIGLRSLIKLALKIRSKKEMYNHNPIYLTDPLTNKRKNKF